MIILPSNKPIIKYPYSRDLPTLFIVNANAQIMWNFSPYSCKNSGSIITTNNTSVTSWDSIGALTESMPSTGTTNPIWYNNRPEFNNKPAVYFNGSTDVLDITSSVLNSGTPIGANGVAIGMTFSLPSKPASSSLIFEYGAPTFPNTQYYRIAATDTAISHVTANGSSVNAFSSYNINTSYSSFMANRNYIVTAYYINQAVVSPNLPFSYAGNNTNRYYPRIRIAPKTPVYISHIVVYKYGGSNNSAVTLSAAQYAPWYSYFKGLYGSVN